MLGVQSLISDVKARNIRYASDPGPIGRAMHSYRTSTVGICASDFAASLKKVIAAFKKQKPDKFPRNALGGGGGGVN